LSHRARSAETPAAETGLFAPPFGLLGDGGSGAPPSGWLLGAVIWAFLTLVWLVFFASSALAARGHEYEPALKIGTPCTELVCAPGELKEPSAVAVNEATGDVYVLDQGNARVQIFDGQTGAFLGGFDGSATPAGSFEFPAAAQNGALAIDNSCALHQPPLTELTTPKCSEFDPSNGDIYVADPGNEHRVVDKFGASGEYRGQFTGLPNEGLEGVAVDPQGTVWIYLERPGILGFRHGSPGEPVGAEVRPDGIIEGENGFGGPGFGVDSVGNFYGRFLRGLSRIVKWDHAGTVLNGKVGAIEPANSVSVEQSSDAAFVDADSELTAFSPEGTKLESFDFGGDLTQGAGIGIDATSGFAYVADRAAGHLLVLTPSQPSAPTVETGNQFVSDVTSVATELHSEVNPRSEEGETPTTYRFQYGPCPSLSACATSPYGFSTPAATLAPDFQAHPVSATLSGLAPGTVYHYRVVAENSRSIEATLGAESTFTTQPSGGLLLSDSRQWEMVSPPEKQGARFTVNNVGIIQAAQNGDALTYISKTPTSSVPTGSALEQQLLSSRSARGWTTHDIGLPHLSVTGAGLSSGVEYRFFSADLGRAAVQPLGPFNPTLSAEASEQTAFLHDLGESCGSACYRPLVTGKSGFANVPPGTRFGEDEECEPGPERQARVVCGPRFLGATEDLSHIVLSANAALTPGSAPEGGLFEWTGGALHPVSVLPNGEAVSNSFLGTTGSEAARRAISADGTRLVWGTEVAGLRHLYLRANSTAPQSASGACDEAGKACTLELDQGEGCPECESGGGLFQIASTDGSRAFFTDEKPLTEDSGARPGSADLYECRIVPAGEGLGCNLTDLTAKHGEESAAVQDNVLGASEDGSTIYFVANGVLTEAPNAEGQEAVAGQLNLYSRDALGTGFIARLSSVDHQDWRGLDNQPTRVSSSGRFLEFMSQAPLTGFDNRDRSTGQAVAEVYLYDGQAKRLRCASCEPTGARPLGTEYLNGLLASGGRDVWQTHSLIAAIVPGWTLMKAGPLQSRYQPRYLNDEGRVFFNSPFALVPQDSNGTYDVYEFEPAGVGDCTGLLSTFSQRNGGCVSLISSGTSREESAFMDASESGDDAFFLTYSRLNPQDVDSALDVYDAHVCSAASPCLPSPPAPAPACEGDACQQPATPPSDQTPGSLSFSGAGNVLQCPKGKVKRSGNCVKKHKAQHHKSKKSKKHNTHKRSANSKRGAGR
jgi:DNA-binding beta-propeller fold protein YncE